MPPSAHQAGGRRSRRWTRETIIDRIAEWADLHGTPPCSADWNPSLARWRGQEWRIERYVGGEWPSTNAVKRHFGGSFDAAVIAAGFAPARPGPKPRAAIEAGLADDSARSPEVQIAALARRIARAEARIAAADARATDARRRARLATERETRARRARDRLVVAGIEIEERVAAIAADADARVRAATDQAEAALRDSVHARRAAAAAQARAAASEARTRATTDVEAAARAGGSEAAWEAARAAEQRAAALESELQELGELLTAQRRRLTAEEVAALRERGPSGPGVVAAALRRLGAARASGDRLALSEALTDLTAAALAWREQL